ncbi:hypothetical protein EDD66_11343 [Mobilisporobacter senegalensis]|uniref:ABC-2 family transporter n=1 Tax=Mobilisporobacter senegalensis TaxID=1329262 RepID=A0A3N1XCA1_9FIRM|nr:hypothetical protein [Mobilisporobacter senegalensis]ROR23648.1 hypothetical protein EDD66_11343 [Mobilisporobacter senegalensis]
MLSKLIKHEFKATARYFTLIFLVALILTPVTKIIVSLDIYKGFLQVIPTFFIMAYVFSLIGIAIVSVVVIIIRFYQNLISSEGYLMNTLPVTSSQLIISKVVAAFTWTVVSIVFIIASLIFFAYFPELNNSGKNFDWMFQIQNDFGKLGITFIIQFVILATIGILSNILYIYVSIAIGQMISRNKIIGAIAAAIVINIITQIFSALFLIPIVFLGVNVNDPSIIVQWIFPMSIAATAIMTVIYYLVTVYIMKKKLNLD